MAYYSYPTTTVHSLGLEEEIALQPWSAKFKHITTIGTTVWLNFPTPLDPSEKLELDALIASHDPTAYPTAQNQEKTDAINAILGYFLTQEGAMMASIPVIKNVIQHLPTPILHTILNDIEEMTEE